MPLTGDASDRRYFRVLFEGRQADRAGAAPGPDRLRLDAVRGGRAAAAEVPLPVPAILHHSNALGILGLEDLGDVTLQAHLGAATAGEHAALYRQAVTFDRAAAAARRGAASDAVPAVSHRLRRREADVGAGILRQALPDGLQGRGAVRRRSARRCAREWSAIVEELAGEPRVLCHRDYHSRNLMLHDGALYIIDFQDARMGPDTYDLVSLLRDSYVDLTAQQVDELIAFFLALKGGGRPPAGGVPPPLRPDGAAAQPEGARHVRLHDDVADNTVYIQYIPRTLQLRRRPTWPKYPRFERLRALLDPWL